MSSPGSRPVIAETVNWVEKAVIGLNLCPFAKAVYVKEQVRYVVSPARTPEALLETLMDELQDLAEADPEKVDTTLIIHPFVLDDFLDFNEFLDVADAAVEDMRPRRRAAGGQLPPGLPVRRHRQERHRELHQPRAVPDPAPAARRQHRPRRGGLPGAEPTIFEKNIETMEQLGHEGWDKLDVGPAR
jgi:hypothetical protein